MKTRATSSSRKRGSIPVFAGMTILLLLAGCAHTQGQSMRFAQGDVALCKHCNCYMPAHLAPDAPCTACECHYPAAACYRGKS